MTTQPAPAAECEHQVLRWLSVNCERGYLRPPGIINGFGVCVRCGEMEAFERVCVECSVTVEATGDAV